MTAWELGDQDEGRHPPGPEELWGESWYLDWAAPDASYGGYVRLGLYPNLGRAWWWVAIVGEGRPTVLVVEHELPVLPRGVHVDSGGHKVELSWPAPMQRFRVTSEGPGRRLDDPADVFHGRVGAPVPVGLDLQWESRGPAFPYAMTTRYEISSWVTGHVTVGDETMAIDCAGQRDHSWGVRDWWLFPWNWTSGHLDDGAYFHAARSIIPELELFETGYTIDAGGSFREIDGATVEVEVDAESLPVRAAQRIGPVSFSTEAVGHAALLLVADDGRETRFPRALCRYRTDDGRTGTGWTEYNWPPGWPRDAGSPTPG